MTEEIDRFAEQFKDGQRRVWAMGDYPEIAAHLHPVSEALVERIGIDPGMRVLDVATGTGNAALLAAARGAEVTGIDLTPEMFPLARARAEQAGLSVTFLEADAEDLPLPDAAYDRVLSVFGVIFAPRHEQAAAELWRVCAPGGAIGVACWTPSGPMSEIFRILGEAGPPPPPFFRPPVRWGEPDYLAGLFPGGRLEAIPAHVPFRYDSVEDWLAFNEANSGPFMAGKAYLEAAGAWDEVRARLVDSATAANQDPDAFELRAEYLLGIVHKPL